MKWPWSRRAEPQNSTLSIADPALAAYFNPGGYVDLAGASVNQHTILGLSAVFRAVSLISGTLASLPLRSYREGAGGMPERVASIFDNPDGDEGQTQFEWEETLFAHLVIHGRAGALKVRNEAGSLVRLPLVHPVSFAVEQPTTDEYANPDRLPVGGKWFRVSLDDGTQVKLDERDFWYVPALSLDGIHGMGLLQAACMSMSTSIAADRAAAKAFSSGALISGLATPDDDVDLVDDLPQIRAELNRSVNGYENAGTIAIVNRRLKFQPWVMTAQQAQFLESRGFQIEEVARWTGVPPTLLMQLDKQTSWGTGVEEQNRALGRTVLAPWANRLEGRGSRLLARPRWLEMDFAGLERPSPDREIELLLAQTGKPFLTVNEARKIRNLPPVEGGDVLGAPAPAPAPDEDPAEEDDDDPAAE
ncbi:phage portal protein [Actinoplanes sp. NPDC049668]|uniref:phage portal protein n=1 Tax=unclassified Actinoplanes TaxID=2626549 RepID=UPI0033BB477A